ncbi:MAG: DUF924 domain-containing protein [Candidatus Gracilibacteria bacterium]|nr:DUF924 domain-containing protein [Candidatus Gracilibacteria bacterium]
MLNKNTIDEIIHFWFVETSLKQKFMQDIEYDKLVISRFLKVYDDIIAGETEKWRSIPEGRLAEIIVLDQFSRNMFRGDKKSFATDELALSLAKEAVEIGMDKLLPREYQAFIYMPYMHSESIDVHKDALDIFTEYGDKTKLEFEIIHKNIIDRFGRYPHRNEILGRESTPEEKDFLQSHLGF